MFLYELLETVGYQFIFLSLKSEASPTQRYLNFECKVRHCKLFIIKQFIFLHVIDLIKSIN